MLQDSCFPGYSPLQHLRLSPSFSPWEVVPMHRPVTNPPFDAGAPPYEESLQYEELLQYEESSQYDGVVGSLVDPNPSYNGILRGLGEHSVYHPRAPSYTSSYPEHFHNDKHNAAPNIFPQVPEVCKNVVGGRTVDTQVSRWPPHGLCQSTTGFVPPNSCNPQVDYSSAVASFASDHPVYYNPQATPPVATRNFAHIKPRRRMTITIPQNTPYRPRVASPRVVEASQSRRKDGGSIYTCDECGATLTSHQNLRYHVNAHYNIKPFPCDHCPKSFGTSHDRNRHYRACAAKKQSSP